MRFCASIEIPANHHRTKLALTGILDRCLLEIGELYRVAGFSNLAFSSTAEKLLLQGSDDALPEILNRLSGGGTAEAEQKIKVQLKVEREKVQTAVVGKGKEVEPLLAASRPPMDEAENGGELQRRSYLAKLLIDRLHDREVYTLVYKMRISDLPGAHSPENPHVQKLLRLYGQPKNRLEFLEGRNSVPAAPGVTHYVLPARCSDECESCRSESLRRGRGERIRRVREEA